MLLIGIGTLCVLSFQNCSNGGPRGTYEVAGDTSSSSTVAASGSDESDDSNQSSGSSDNGSSNGSGAAPSTGTSLDPSLLFNFVAETQQACDNSVKERLGKSVTCNFGGACGVSCGRPSPTCQSSGLGKYGACLDSKGTFECKKAGTMIAFQNCGGITQPSSEVQTAPKSLTGCCSDTIYRVCAVNGNNIANYIVCQ